MCDKTPHSGKNADRSSEKTKTGSATPTVEQIRQAHQIESERISEAIRTGNVDDLGVSESVFTQLVGPLTPEQRLDRLRKRVDVSGAVRTYNRITQAWKLKRSDVLALIGNPDETTYQAWQNNSGPPIQPDTLERISYVLGIYKALRTLFPNEDQANAWIKKSNRHFDGRAALEVMLDGDLATVRRYLDGRCQ
ncbi:MbcA/ParS/Xre antitoxin family protein [Marinobacter sp. 1Y8]|tara:strand:- start:1037 stop:1615 length:579 start_codon:yes stop_codon:yes gene_type:complete